VSSRCTQGSGRQSFQFIIENTILCAAYWERHQRCCRRQDWGCWGKNQKKETIHSFFLLFLSNVFIYWSGLLFGNKMWKEKDWICVTIRKRREREWWKKNWKIIITSDPIKDSCLEEFSFFASFFLCAPRQWKCVLKMTKPILARRLFSKSL